jgi:hypothetical protein
LEKLKAKMDFDELLVDIGEFGRFQIILFFLLGMRSIVGAYADYIAIFIYGIPEYRYVLSRLGEFTMAAVYM